MKKCYCSKSGNELERYEVIIDYYLHNDTCGLVEGTRFSKRILEEQNWLAFSEIISNSKSILDGKYLILPKTKNEILKKIRLYEEDFDILMAEQRNLNDDKARACE